MKDVAGIEDDMSLTKERFEETKIAKSDENMHQIKV